MIKQIVRVFIFKELFENVVEKAWVNEEKFHQAIFNKKLDRTASICQGMSRQIVSILGDVFDDVRTISIRVKKRTHLIVFVQHDGLKFILDGTIRQFKRNENRTVWFFDSYPYQKELKKSKTWTIVELKK